ncbi:MAG: hypothetical protein ACLU5K_01750 [Christensenellales bacterium]
MLQKVRELDPDAEIGLLYANAMVDPWVYAKYLNANAIHPNYRAALPAPALWKGA